MAEHKSHSRLRHRKHREEGGPIKDESVKHGSHHNKVDSKHTKPGGSTGEAEGNKKVLHEAHEGLKGGGHIAGGSERGGLHRKRGGKAHGEHGHHRAHGGEVGADKHPFSSAHKHGGKCE
jgi:hypothetical protein